jgi:hypothetical protein
MDLLDRHSSLEQLRRHLQDAKVRYEFAKTYAAEVRQDFENRFIDEPVEILAYRKALSAELEALLECNRVLRAMADLALRGTLSNCVQAGGSLAKKAQQPAPPVSGIPR